MIPLLLSVLHLAPAGGIGVKLPELSQLTLAVRSGDEVEVERVAARLGAVRLERVAEKGKREERLAALKALAVVADGWAMLPALAQLLGDSDGDVAEQAAVTARRIAEGLSPETVEREEVPRDVPQRAAQALLTVAARPELRPSLRVAAVAAVGALRGVAHLDEGSLQKLLSDGEPQVRRAAAEAMAGVAAADKALEGAAAGDAVPEVAAAAGAALCRDVPATSAPKSVAEIRAARLPPATRERLRKLALDDTLSLADRLDLMGCLRVGLVPAEKVADQNLLDQLAKRAPDSLKRRARSLGGK